MNPGKLSCSLIALVLATAVAAAVPETAKDNEQLIRYYRKKANVPAAQKIAVTNLKESAIKKMKEGTLEIGEGAGVRKVPFVVSEDGRYAIFGGIEDVSIDPSKAVMAKINLAGYPSRGGDAAKVVIVEYSDFQCPFCSRAYTTMEQVLKEYGDKVKLYFKNYPLGFHPWAEPAAVAAECARLQNADAYWTIYKGVFEAQQQINPTNVKEKITAMLADSKIDMEKFNTCYDTKATLAEVKAQMAEGSTVGVSGTPGFIINGRLVSGAQPIEQFKTIIDDELANLK